MAWIYGGGGVFSLLRMPRAALSTLRAKRPPSALSATVDTSEDPKTPKTRASGGSCSSKNRAEDEAML